MASNAFRIIYDAELGKPYLLPECPGNNLARGNDGLEGRGIGKKRRVTCNELYRGSKFALTRKGADLSMVFHCMNGGKPINVRYSTTLKSERLTDAQCVNRLQTGITKAVIEVITAARYRKGYGMLERYEGKLSRTVLRGLEAGNGLRLLGTCRMEGTCSGS